MGELWRGNWATRLRIGSGLILMLYVLLHFTNIALGLFEGEAMDRFQSVRLAVNRTLPGFVVIYGALLTHGLLGLWRLAGRRTLRMPVAEAAQLVLGLFIPLMLVAHVVFTRAAHEIYGVQDKYDYLIGLIWGSPSARNQALLLLIVWTHGCLGLHFWLRTQGWWRRWLPALTGFAVLVPALALAGFLVEGQRVADRLADPDTQAALFRAWNWPSPETFGALLRLNSIVWWTVLGTMLLSVAVFYGRKLLSARRSVRITYVDGPEITAPKGPTLLEMSRGAGVPHTSLCGGRGRCTTCRVIVEAGADLLHPPEPAEERSLRAVQAPPNARLACQIKPTDPLTVFRVFQPDGRRVRAHASQGQERRLAVLFLDIRGFTSRTAGQLPYDVVFLLNRFFDAVVPAITEQGGTVDKYLGDGFLALFESRDAASSARAGLRAVEGIGAALKRFNDQMVSEGGTPIAIGIGLHLGDVVLGEIGAAGNAPRTLIGDTVNTASRLESKTKDLSVQLLVSEAVLQAAGYDTAGADLLTLELRGVDHPLNALALADSTGLGAVLSRLATTDAPTAAE